MPPCASWFWVGPRWVTARRPSRLQPGLEMWVRLADEKNRYAGSTTALPPAWIENRGGQMAPSVLYMSMSLDGYIAGPNDGPDNPGGDGFDRLHEWYGEDFHPEGLAGQVVDEGNAYGAIVVGRRTVEQI